MSFELTAPYSPTGDQPQAIEALVRRFKEHKQFQTLLGVTGSGKTFTMANVISQLKKPTLIIAHNKTLAAQLYQEFRDFFPTAAVSYFVSYYDYYQPEAYIPSTDTYIEKESTINDEIDKLRLASTTNLLTREDCIVIASVSCIYNLGSPIEYGKYVLEIIEGELIARETLLLQLANLQYERSESDLNRGSYRLRGDTIQLWPAYQDTAIKIETLENRIVSIQSIDPVSGTPLKATPPTTHEVTASMAQLFSSSPDKPNRCVIYPAKHYMTNPKTVDQSIKEIETDLHDRLEFLRSTGKVIEAYRLEQKVRYDLDMIREVGFVNGIENYSRYFDGRQPGDPPYTLIDYFHENAKHFSKDGFLTIIDESHITIPQIGGMHNGDRSRKNTLIEYGFRLPSATDNRPYNFTEFMSRMSQMLMVSATPDTWEISQSGGEVVEQLVRPTGLIDPTIELRPTEGQIEDLVIEIIRRKQLGQRALVTTLTKKMAEALTEYLNDHRKIDTLLEQSQKRANAATDADTPLQQSVEVAASIPIGPIDQEYFTHATVQMHEIWRHHQDSQSSTTRDQQLTDIEYPLVAYLHSDVETFERSDILDDLRRGKYDVVVGINLLREGLDLPEVTLVAILDADKEGFLRSATSLIQTIGRAARHESGQAILYADRMTRSMKKAISETSRRRRYQIEYNQKNHITPTTIFKPVRDKLLTLEARQQRAKKDRALHPGSAYEQLQVIELDGGERIRIEDLDGEALTPSDRKKLHLKIRRKMKKAADEMDFELATLLRDAAKKLE